MTDRLNSAGEEGAGRRQGGTKKEMEREMGNGVRN